MRSFIVKSQNTNFFYRTKQTFAMIINYTLNDLSLGDAMEQTKYVANSEAWKLYDPLFTQYRSLYQRDVQKVSFIANLRWSF